MSIWRVLPIIETMLGEEMSYFGIADISKILTIRIPPFSLENYSLNKDTVIKLMERKLKV